MLKPNSSGPTTRFVQRTIWVNPNCLSLNDSRDLKRSSDSIFQWHQWHPMTIMTQGWHLLRRSLRFLPGMSCRAGRAGSSGLLHCSCRILYTPLAASSMKFCRCCRCHALSDFEEVTVAGRKYDTLEVPCVPFPHVPTCCAMSGAMWCIL